MKFRAYYPLFTGSNLSGEPEQISTSFVEKQNHFSKKLGNFQAAVGLHFAYYNFVKMHRTVRITPAMAAGVEPSALEVADLVDMAR